MPRCPIVLAGNGVVRQSASDALRSFGAEEQHAIGSIQSSFPEEFAAHLEGAPAAAEIPVPKIVAIVAAEQPSTTAKRANAPTGPMPTTREGGRVVVWVRRLGADIGDLLIRAETKVRQVHAVESDVPV